MWDMSTEPAFGGTVAVADQDRRGPGRPRSAQADEAIAEAVLNLLAEGVAVESLSMEAVAARAGVGKATIYRRWPNKEAMLVDAVGRVKGELPEITGESLREDLLALLRPISRMNVTRAAQIMPCLVPLLQRSAELRELYQQLMKPRRDLMRQVLRRGIERGELRSDIDIEVVVVMLNGPLVARSVLTWSSDVPLDNL